MKIMKKGFTLVELLAVIIVLAAILSIVTPIVSDLIRNSKNKTKKASIEMYGRALAQASLAYELKEEKIPSTLEDIEPYLNYSGDDVECNYTIISSGGKVHLSFCSVNGKEIKDYSFGNDFFANSIIKDAKENDYYYEEAPDFNNTTIEGEYGLYSMEDDLGTSYYFRGDVENNYVQFGSWSEITNNKYYGVDYYIGNGYDTYEECMRMHTENNAPWESCELSITAQEGDKMYWRIVRINGDGTIRLVYDGTSAEENSKNHFASIGLSAYDSNRNVKYSYLSGTVQKDSTIKAYIDGWYNTHLKNNYGKYIADSIFCNDASSIKTYYFQYDADSNGTKETVTMMGYPALGRIILLVSEIAPILKCNTKEDKYTISSEFGNGLLSNPIGLLTADEVAFAGLINGVEMNVENYLYHGSKTDFTMTPGSVESIFFYNSSLQLADYSDAIKNVRPVINLKANVEFTGTGTIDDPYVIVTD